MILFLVVGTKLFMLYRDIYSANVDLDGKKKSFLFIRTGAEIPEILDSLEQNGWIRNKRSLQWVMEKKNYASHIHAGRYLLVDGMSNNVLVNLLRSGMQTPISLTFNNTRTVEEFAGKIASQIEPDSVTILNYLKDGDYLSQYGFTPASSIGMFIPNTYQVYWNINADGFFRRMYKEYLAFWSVNRLKKAEKVGLSPKEIGVLASIVDEETIMNDEKSKVAGVYVNRLKRKIRLQADPTLKFALGDFTIRRILNQHKKIDSPYNTYKYRGLPPGPIRQPSITGIDAVLNYQKHRYLYFCAKPDFSGYHVFARTLKEHNRNARKYQNALNKERIYR
jgi:UPF0755 protein